MFDEGAAPATDTPIGAIESGGSRPSDGGDSVPIEVLEHRLTTHAGHLAAAEAEWLGWLCEWCVRRGWESWGCAGPVAWLAWQCGLSPAAARDKVRVAMALKELPVIAARMGQGKLSYSKVRALTRVATPANDEDLAELGVAATGAQLETIVRAYKKAGDADNAARSAWATRSWRSREVDGDVTVFTLRVPNDQADLVDLAIRNEVNATIGDAVELVETPDGSARAEARSRVIQDRGGWSAMAADAAVALLIGTARSDEVPAVDVELIVPEPHDGESGATECVAIEGDECASAEALEWVVGGRSLAAPVGQRLCCDPRVAVLIEDAHRKATGVSDKKRFVSRRLRRALGRRDRNQCRFPGCCATRRLDAHHIIHWANGGPTVLDNLILLCSFHHHQVHEGGWNLRRYSHEFVRPDGTVVDSNPTSRFRGSASAVTTAGGRRFDSPAPLAEAGNEPYDLGLVIESLTFDRRLRERCAHLHASAEASPTASTPSGYTPLRPLGPPVPDDLHRMRMMEAHRERNKDTDALIDFAAV